MDLLRPRVDTDLAAVIADAVRQGPFEHALHTAMQVRGLSLERVRRKLRDQGVDISLTTLSYWRRGRSRPEGDRSLRAVRAIEEVLRLPPESLIALLGPKKPRGRWLNHVPPIRRPEDILGTGCLATLLREFNAPTSDCYTWLSVHETVTLDERGAESRVHVRQVMQAKQDHLDRYLFIYRASSPERPLPVIADVHSARLGRVRRDEQAGVVLAELLYDRVLGQGDTAVLDYEYTFAKAEPTNHYERAFGTPARQYVLEIQFDPAAVPVHCFHATRPSMSAELEYGAELWIGASLRVHRVLVDLGPVCHGIAWEWQ